VARLPLITAPEVGVADLQGVMKRLGGERAALAALAGAAPESRTEERPA
jgi:hypothetical protein